MIISTAISLLSFLYQNASPLSLGKLPPMLPRPLHSSPNPLWQAQTGAVNKYLSTCFVPSPVLET